jgi:putative nucleotidyltransferase with HDIG domain
MCIHIVADTKSKLSALRALVEPYFSVSSELLDQAGIRGSAIDAAVVAANLGDVENISALKQLAPRLNRVERRIFIIDQKSRLSLAQACALGATHVLTTPFKPAQLLSKLPNKTGIATSDDRSWDGPQVAMGAAASIAAMFKAVSSGTRIDVDGVTKAGGRIADTIAETSLSEWLDTVRRHHEGTYQHCLLVTGVAVDFGLSLGLNGADMARLYSAAMFHDLGKARIPLSVLDKPGRLDPNERALIETHPAAGHEALETNAQISQEILDAVLHHHEFLDGSGYPHGLLAENISDIVRILTICDIFAALIECRPYKATMPRDQAYEILMGMSGKLERPLVAAFREVALMR